MKIITNLRQLKGQFKKPVIAIGIFDGVHLGHKKILREVVRAAKKISGTSVCLTFNPHPRKVLDIIGSPPFLVSVRHRINLIAREGISVACLLDFNKIFAGYGAEYFIKNIIAGKLKACEVIVGKGFKFGRGKKGDIRLLEKMGRRYGFRAAEVPLRMSGGRPISSTRIRQLVMSGELARASRLLGRPVSILGTVVRGSRRGRLLGFPTANINPHHEAIPPSGVYAVHVLYKGKEYKGVLNIGVRPTFKTGHQLKNDEPVIEVHVSNFNKKIYGQDIEVIFVRRLRGERRFHDKNKLIEQIRIDEAKAAMVL